LISWMSSSSQALNSVSTRSNLAKQSRASGGTGYAGNSRTEPIGAKDDGGEDAGVSRGGVAVVPRIVVGWAE